MEKFKYKISPTETSGEFINLSFMLTSDIDNVGLTNIMFESTQEEVAPFTYEKLVSGHTTSKFSLVRNSFKGGAVIINTRVKLRGYNDFGIVNEIRKGFIRYTLFLDSGQPIEYIDYSDGITTFKYMINEDVEYGVNNDVYITEFKNIVEEPKITSDVFINRGVNSVFDSIKRLRTINGLSELEKTGLNFFKINIKGEKR